MFVFSGRRGVHCWVSDRLARKLTDEERTALANYINVYEVRQYSAPWLFLNCDKALNTGLHWCNCVRLFGHDALDRRGNRFNRFTSNCTHPTVLCRAVKANGSTLNTS